MDRLGKGATFLVGPALLLLVWWVATVAHWAPPQILTPPARLWDAFIDLLRSGDLQANLGVSLMRLAAGFIVGAPLGMAFGAALALSPAVRDYAGGLFDAVRQTPSIALIPLLILIFGVGESFKIVLVSEAVFFPVSLAARDAVLNLPRSYLEVCSVYRLPLRTKFLKVVLPAILSPVVTGCRQGLTRAWIVLVAAELLAADKGVGQMMEMGRQLFQLNVVMVGVVVTGIVGFGIDGGMKQVERSLSRGRAI